MNTTRLPAVARHRACLPPRYRMLKRGERLLEPEVYLTRLDGRAAVVKDYSRYRLTPLAPLARVLVRREARALRRLAGWRHAPALLGRIAPLALAIEYVPGIPLSQAGADSPAPVFAQLRGAVARLHAAGITHNDLHPANVLIANGGTPVLIDFASSLRAPRWLRRSPLVRQLRRGDLANVLKMQARLTGIGPGRRQRATLAEPGWVRSIRDGWKRLYRRDRRRAQD